MQTHQVMCSFSLPQFAGDRWHHWSAGAKIALKNVYLFYLLVEGRVGAGGLSTHTLGSVLSGNQVQLILSVPVPCGVSSTVFR